jgi:Predicted exporters of the RND superfamily
VKKQLLDGYGSLVARHPVLVIAGVLLAAGLVAPNAASIETVEQNTEDLLPESIPSVGAFSTLSSEFSRAGGTTYTVLVETDPAYAESSEPRDVRSPRVVSYIISTTRDISRIDRVSAVSSPADSYPEVPASVRESQEYLNSSQSSSRFVSSDYSAARIQVTSTGLSTEEQTRVAERVQQVMERQDAPPGLKISYTGDVYIDQAFQEESQQSQSFTTVVSLVGVLLIVMVLFRSIVNGISSLLGLIFGVAVGLGVYGLLGLNFSPATSGSISIGIGIAIDFGIQVVSRYREEVNDYDPEPALQEALNGVVGPMTVALVAATIGFTALSAGRITFLGELGTVLTLTTGFAYVGALTLIPAAMVVYDRRINPFVSELLT